MSSRSNARLQCALVAAHHEKFLWTYKVKQGDGAEGNGVFATKFQNCDQIRLGKSRPLVCATNLLFLFRDMAIIRALKIL